jgi:vacuolar-type H+-ATPase subunit D/Vma8
MSEAAEITIRDVLQQIDRRLINLEEGARLLHQKMDEIYARLDAKIDAKIGSVRDELNAKIESVYSRLDSKIDTSVAQLNAKIDTKFRWTVGLILVSWLSLVSMMGTLLFRQ